MAEGSEGVYEEEGELLRSQEGFIPPFELLPTTTHDSTLIEEEILRSGRESILGSRWVTSWWMGWWMDPMAFITLRVLLLYASSS